MANSSYILQRGVCLQNPSPLSRLLEPPPPRLDRIFLHILPTSHPSNSVRNTRRTFPYNTNPFRRQKKGGKALITLLSRKTRLVSTAFTQKKKEILRKRRLLKQEHKRRDSRQETLKLGSLSRPILSPVRSRSRPKKAMSIDLMGGGKEVCVCLLTLPPFTLLRFADYNTTCSQMHTRRNTVFPKNRHSCVETLLTGTNVVQTLLFMAAD